jgi:hypothetical protein
MSDPSSPVERALGWLKETWNQAPPTLRRHWPWFIAGGVVGGFLLVFLLRSGQPEPGGPVARGDEAEGSAAGSAGEAAETGQAGGSGQPLNVRPPLSPRAGADAGAPLSPNVKLTFRTYPPRRASVHWGAKRLGFIDRGKPLVIERPRDSGPLDVVIRSQGFLTVHARAYTFNDANVDVKITPVEKKDTLYGYQQPLADAGAPP